MREVFGSQKDQTKREIQITCFQVISVRRNNTSRHAKRQIRFDGEAVFQVCSPFRVGDISRWEKVQKRAIKIPTILKNNDYFYRLETLQLAKLEKRRTRTDFIYMFNIVKGIYHIDLRRSLDFNDSKNRGHDYRFSRENFSAKRANEYSRFVTIRHNFISEQGCSSLEQSTFSSRDRSIIEIS